MTQNQKKYLSVLCLLPLSIILFVLILNPKSLPQKLSYIDCVCKEVGLPYGGSEYVNSENYPDCHLYCKDSKGNPYYSCDELGCDSLPYSCADLYFTPEIDVLCKGE